MEAAGGATGPFRDRKLVKSKKRAGFIHNEHKIPRVVRCIPISEIIYEKDECLRIDKIHSSFLGFFRKPTKGR